MIKRVLRCVGRIDTRWLALVVSLMAIACGLASILHSYGLSKMLAAILSIAVCVFAGITLVLIFRRPEQEVDLSLANKLLERVLRKVPPLLCRRHVTTRAQGSVLGCDAAEAAVQSTRRIRERMRATLSELRMETDAGLFELAEHMAYTSSLANVMGTLRSMKFAEDLEVIAEYGSPGDSQKARALQDDLSSLTNQITSSVYGSLRKLQEQLRSESVAEQVSWQNSKQRVEHALRTAAGFLEVLEKEYVKPMEMCAQQLGDSMRAAWDADQRKASSDYGCRSAS